MRKDLEQGHIVVGELLKAINFLTISSMTTPIESLTQSTINPTIGLTPNSSSTFLEKKKDMQELKAKLLSRQSLPVNPRTKKFAPFDICDPFVSNLLE